MSRAIYGARTAVEVVLLAVVFSIAIGVPLGPDLGLRRRLAGPHPGPDHGRAVRVPVPAAGDRRRVPAHGHDRQRHRRHRDRDHRRLRAAVLPGGASLDAVSAREATYIEAARAMGAKPRTIIRKYLFGNVVQSVPVIATLNAADAILTLAGLGFLGLGIQPSEAAEWGYDLQRAVADAGAGIWWTALYPGPRHRARRDRADAGRRGPQRRAQPDAAASPHQRGRTCSVARSARRRSARRRRPRSRGRRANDRAGPLAARPAHLVRRTSAAPCAPSTASAST